MKIKDIIAALVVFSLLTLVIIYEYRVSVEQIPSSASDRRENALFDGVTSKELSRLIAKKSNVTIIDVRSPGEYEDGQIPGAISIPFSEIKSKSTQHNKNDALILYCESGPWSKVAYNDLKELGFENIRILTNGIVGWKWEIKGELVTENG